MRFWLFVYIVWFINFAFKESLLHIKQKTRKEQKMDNIQCSWTSEKKKMKHIKLGVGIVSLQEM